MDKCDGLEPGGGYTDHPQSQVKEVKKMTDNVKLTRAEAALLRKVRDGSGAKEQAACKKAAWRSFHNCRR